MTDLIDASTDAGAKTQRLLDETLVAWLTTVGTDGAPRAVPVWFLRHDGVVSVISEPDTVKVRNLRADPRVVVNLVAGPFGDDVVVLRGTATLHPDTSTEWLAAHRDAYVAKYAAAIEAYGTPVDEFIRTFTTVIEVTPEHVLGW